VFSITSANQLSILASPRHNYNLGYFFCRAIEFGKVLSSYESGNRTAELLAPLGAGLQKKRVAEAVHPRQVRPRTEREVRVTLIRFSL
jgi:hypothetical protein